ncbi:MAG: CDP-diacylglycerol--glycerol-3-phosphate 3-phosphatidyltransferase [Cyanobacteriota bacterium]|nr:CDP-diacylglycerol--glycerol-3-phosphate 3-phosphatidyltransferase [Cyanobacteriota bacterium]
MNTIPNWVTLSRLLVLPLLFGLGQDPANVEARAWMTGLFLIAAGTDWLDGYLARKLDQVTEIGKFLDPLVDKLLILGPLLIFIQWGQAPSAAVFLILCRELAIAGWRVRGTGEIPGANLWGKAKTVSQIVAVALLLAPLPEPAPTLGQIAFWISVALTLFSGLIYVWPQKPLLRSDKAANLES